MRGVIARFTSDGSSRKALASSVGTGTGTPPASTMPGTYATYDGSATMTSSPSFSVARSARSTASETPTVTRISFFGSYATPRCCIVWSAIASRSARSPQFEVY